jgi:hypothetical protein
MKIQKLSYLIISSVVGLLILFFLFLLTDPIKTDLDQANDLLPLNTDKIYYISTNPSFGDVPEGAYFGIYPEFESSQDILLAYRKIGKTDVDLSPYLGKKVKVYGAHTHNPPLLADPTATSSSKVRETLTNPRSTTIHIHRLELVE